MVSISTSREREVTDGVEATVYLCGRQCSQLGMRTWEEGGALVGGEGRGGSTAVEVLTSLHIEESREGLVLKDSTYKHTKQLELGSGDIWSIHCDAENPLVHPPSCPLP